MNPKAPPVLAREWLSTPPIDKHDLVGRVRVIVFWSIGCEASLIRLQEVAGLADQLSPSLSVLAIHTPRFAFEHDRSLVEESLGRVPTVATMATAHDPELMTWARYNPGGWPAVVLVDHRGRALGVSLGLDDLTPLAEAAQFALLRAEKKIAKGSLSPRPLPAPTAPFYNQRDEGLSWPSGVCRVGNHMVAVADGGNDRVLVVGLARDLRSGQLTHSFDDLEGARRVCMLDATHLAVSRPDHGQVIGLDLDNPNNRWVIADNLERPQGLTVDRDGSLIIADAGDNQLVRVLDDGQVGVVAGNGFSGQIDGPAAAAELAQPVGVTRTQRGLAFVDAASSNLRLLTDKGHVTTVTDNSFNDYGLTDGPAHQASLQRPTSVATLTDGSLVVADTGNHRLRRLEKRRLRTLGLAGLRLPEDLAVVAEDLLIVADSGNHRLVMVDLSDNTVWKLEINGLLPTLYPMPTPVRLEGQVGETVRLPFPTPGHGPWTVRVRSTPSDLVEPIEVSRDSPSDEITVSLSQAGVGELIVESTGPHPTQSLWQAHPLHSIS